MGEYTKVMIRHRVVEKAMIRGGFTHAYVDGRLFRFPTEPLLWYIFDRMPSTHHLLPAYEPVSPSGLKMMGDDRYHSDVWIGAGLDIEDCYDRDHVGNRALSAATATLEEEWAEKIMFNFTILANGLPTHINSFIFRVYDHELLPPNTTRSSSVFCADPPKLKHDTARAIVIPYAGVEFDIPARYAEVVITEVGGPLAHLSTLARERKQLVIRVNDAVERFSWPTKLHINLNQLTLDPIQS